MNREHLKAMSELQQIPSIGSSLARNIIECGINSVKNFGVVEVISWEFNHVRIKTIDQFSENLQELYYYFGQRTERNR